MLWSLSVTKVRLWNKRHSKKAKHYYLWSSMKYKNIHTDYLCILSGFFYNLGYLWSLRVAISISVSKRSALQGHPAWWRYTEKPLGWVSSCSTSSQPVRWLFAWQEKFQPSLQYLVQKCASIFQNPAGKFGQPGAEGKEKKKKKNYCNRNWIIISG